MMMAMRMSWGLRRWGWCEDDSDDDNDGGDGEDDDDNNNDDDDDDDDSSGYVDVGVGDAADVEDADADLDGTGDIKVSWAVTGTNIVVTRVACCSAVIMFGSVSREGDVGDIVSEHARRNCQCHIILYIIYVWL